DDLAGTRVARRILRREPEIEVAHRNPAALAAPAHMDDLRVEREQTAERLHGLRRVVLEARDELEPACGDSQHHRIFAPCAIHVPSNRRSRSVMFVAFPSGIVCVCTANCSMSDACVAICCAVSNSMPIGALVNWGLRGCAEWQYAQRSCTIGWICANVTGFVLADTGVDAGSIHTARPAIAAAQPTGIHQSVWPACRRLK